jgi:3-oxoacyl-[acyl-carrier-protein] synthase II
MTNKGDPMKTLKRVVVTGLGAITPIGNNVTDYWTALKNGTSGAGPVTKLDVSKFKTQFACEVKGFDPSAFIDPKEIRSMDLYTQYAVVAADQAAEDAKIKGMGGDPFRKGVIFASGVGGLLTMQEEIEKFVKNDYKPRFSPHFIVRMISNIAAGIIGLRFDFRGMNYGTVSACASANHAMIDAFNYIRLGKADVIITGGAEASVNATSLGGFSCMKAISERNDDPATASRPFDADRDGFVLGEGAGALVLESLDSALARGATIYAEVIGGGMTADAYHYTLPHPEGRSVYQAMKMAIEDADIGTEAVDYINLHGTSTPAGDPAELLAVQSLFENSLSKLHVSATKSMTGHLLGAAGAIEGIATILAIKNGVVPPTINTKNIDPKIDVKVDLTLGKAVEKNITVAISNTFGFGGQNASIVFRKYEG